MAAPNYQNIILAPPHPPTNITDFNSLSQYLSILYKFNYHIWDRVGGYSSIIPDLSNLNVSVAEINTLAGINTGVTVQQQLNSKVDLDSIGTMAYQDASSVDITGGFIVGVDFDNGNWVNGTITNASIQNATINNPIITSGSMTNTNVLIALGESGATIPIGGTANVDTTPIGSIGALESVLISYIVAANSLNEDGNYFEVTAYGNLAANANNKRIRLYFGTTLLLDTGSVAANAGSWYIDSKIVRIDANSQHAISKIISDNSLILNASNLVFPAEDSADPINIYCTGEGVADDDIIQYGLIVKWFK